MLGPEKDRPLPPNSPQRIRVKDQEFAAIRDLYFSLNEDERTRFHSWIQSVASIQRPPIEILTFMSIRLWCNENDELKEANPSDLLRAVEEWKNGGHYTPDGMTPHP